MKTPKSEPAATGISQFRTCAIMLLLLVTFASCKKDEDPEPVVINEENHYVNTWIQDQMEFWYLWNETMPKNNDKNLSPDDYFESLLNTDDRFSWIQNNYEELLNSLNGINMEGGFEYVLYKESSTSNNVVAQIMYVKPNSPALTAGLKRGDLVMRINGQTMTTTNYRDVIQQLKENHTLTIKPILIGEDAFGPEENHSLSVVEYAENPNHLHTILEMEGKKIGYYVYTFFSSGNQETYDNEMDNIFSEFKNAGITDLVLDLRFNSGGSESSAKNLASLVGAGINSSSVFFKRQYNKLVNDEILKTPALGEAYLTARFADETGNVGSMLTGNRVYVLTSSRTASASELIINSLRPYMEVFLIGDVTYGKNVGSISIYEEDDARNKWGLQPIVLKVANSLGTADYGSGFTPDILNKDNSLHLYPLGDVRENLLSEAVAHITGKPASGGRAAALARDTGRELLRHSLDENPRSFRLDMNESMMPALSK